MKLGLKYFLILAITFCVLILTFLSVRSQKHPAKISSPKVSTKLNTLREPLVIMLQPLGNVSASKIKFIQSEVKEFYKADLVLLGKNVPLPKMAWYEPRKRYVADSLLIFLGKKKPDAAKFILGITDKDIATQKGTNPNYGIMGLGYCPGPTCVVSTSRLHKKIQSTKKGEIEKIFLERFSKVCLHELGHNFGLEHCSVNDSCFMNDADGTIAQVDKERKYICPMCSAKIFR